MVYMTTTLQHTLACLQNIRSLLESYIHQLVWTLLMADSPYFWQTRLIFAFKSVCRPHQDLNSSPCSSGRTWFRMFDRPGLLSALHTVSLTTGKITLIEIKRKKTEIKMMFLLGKCQQIINSISNITKRHRRGDLSVKIQCWQCWQPPSNPAPPAVWASWLPTTSPDTDQIFKFQIVVDHHDNDCQLCEGPLLHQDCILQLLNYLVRLHRLSYQEKQSTEIINLYE